MKLSLGGLVGLTVVLAAAAPGAAGMLCVDGHPAKRRADVTYGGLAPRAGFERDHIIPLCLGGPDDAGNVQYQPWAAARVKDEWERRACVAYCRGEVELEQARAMVKAAPLSPRR